MAHLEIYLRVLRKWFVWLVVVVLIAGTATFVISSNQPPIYSASAKIAIGGISQAPDLERNDVLVGVELTSFYVQLVGTYEVLNAAVEALELPLDADDLDEQVSARAIRNTPLLEITVTHPNQLQVADIANEVARQLIEQSPSNLTPEQQTQLNIANSQIERLTEQLNTLNEQMSVLDDRIAGDDSTGVDTLIQQRNTLTDQINQVTSNIAQFSETVTTLQDRRNSLEVVEAARIPTRSDNLNPMLVTLVIAAAVGSIVTAGVFMLEALNDTFRSTDEVTQQLGVPVIGMISRSSKMSTNRNDNLFASDFFGSPNAIEYTMLRTNVLFSANKEAKKMYIVTSPIPQDGKSTTAANFAVSLAISGLRVLLIDADLRRPQVHNYFGVKNDVGFTTALQYDAELLTEQLSTNGKDVLHILRQCIQPTNIENLEIMSSGFLPNNPAELLGSTTLRVFVQALSEADIDVIVFDTPPSLALPDASILASISKADVLLVVRANRTRRNQAIKTKERLQQVNASIIGAILNDVDTRFNDYYGYGYSYKYYTQARGN